MAYTDDAVKAKLSALNETQESIVTVAQWVMFHRRHADRTAQLWLEKLRDSNPSKRLNLIYLANEVAQQSKARRKDDFLIAFSPIVADATATAFKGAPNEVQQKLKRVVEVWRQRSIFEPPIQDAVEARIEEADKSRSSGKKPLLGGSLFSNSSGSVPPELQSIAQSQTAVSKATVSSNSTVTAANSEYAKMHDPSAQVPTPPVHAARLSQVLKSLANAENSVSESMKSREKLIQGLEQLLETNRSALTKEQSQASELSERKAEIEAKKREVEDAIMRGMSADNPPQSHENGESASDQLHNHQAYADGGTEASPAVEALTPPPVEALTPPPQLPDDHDNDQIELPLNSEPQPPIIQSAQDDHAMPQQPRPSNSPPNGSAHKKRKVDYADEGEHYAGFEGGDAMADFDADVAELLRQESNKY